MTPVHSTRSSYRVLSGGTITVLGLLLLGIPLYDIIDDVMALDWMLLVTLAENALFLVLSLGLVLSGIWLIQSEWDTRYVALVSKWTTGGSLVLTLLFGWVVAIQLWAMGQLKPYVIAMDGVLIGTTVTFGVGLLSAKTARQQSELQWQQQAKASLETLHQIATELQAAQDEDEAYAVVFDGIETLLAPESARITIDGETVAERFFREQDGENANQSSITASIGERGELALFGSGFAEYEVDALDVLGTHADRTIARIEREQALAAERDKFDLINRTLRHELLNDLQLVQARVGILEEEGRLIDDHLEVIQTRITEMAQFVEQMREYMHLFERDDDDLEPVELRPSLGDAIQTIETDYSVVDIQVERIPEMRVIADELLEPVFENLLRNAVEHNDKETPEIEVSGERANGRVAVEIADNGPGIPDARKEALTQRGTQLTDSNGSGFGLYLVAEAVDTYGGELQIRDNEPSGTVIRITLPIAQ